MRACVWLANTVHCWLMLRCVVANVEPGLTFLTDNPAFFAGASASGLLLWQWSGFIELKKGAVFLYAVLIVRLNTTFGYSDMSCTLLAPNRKIPHVVQEWINSWHCSPLKMLNIGTGDQLLAAFTQKFQLHTGLKTSCKSNSNCNQWVRVWSCMCRLPTVRVAT